MLEEPWDQGVIHWNLTIDPRLEAEADGPEHAPDKHDAYLDASV